MPFVNMPPEFVKLPTVSVKPPKFSVPLLTVTTAASEKRLLLARVSVPPLTTTFDTDCVPETEVVVADAVRVPEKVLLPESVTVPVLVPEIVRLRPVP